MAGHQHDGEHECAACSLGMEGFQAQLEEHIAEFGWSVVGVGGDATGPSFSYTVGLNTQGWHELIMVGVHPVYAQQIINSIGLTCKDRGTGPQDGEVFTEAATLPCTLLECGDWVTEEYAVQAQARAERAGQQPIKCMQIVVPDREGLFPWQQGYDHAYMDPCQPALTPTRQWPRLN